MIEVLNRMSKFCSECGSQLSENTEFCPNCGNSIGGSKIVINNIVPTNDVSGKGTATVSVVFGSLGFYPLIFIGSVVGIITGIIGVSNKNSKYIGRAKIGLWLSIGSLVFWIILILL